MADPTNPRPTKRKVTDVEKEEQHPPIQPISLAKKYASGPPSASLDVKEPPRKKKKISGSHDTVPQKPNRKTKGDGRSAPIPTSTQKPPLVTTADIDSTSATTIKGKGKAPAKKTKNASKESKAFEISEENEFIILCWNNQGCERDFHLSGQRLWSEVTERYKVKFNKPDTSVGAVQGRYFVWHQRYCEADSEYAETIAKEAWAASKTAAKAKKRNMTPKEGTAGLAKELSKTKKEKTSSTTNTIESTKSSKKSETALKVNAPLLTKMPAPKSGESIKETQKYLNKDASPETAASMSDESEEHKFGYSNLHLENGFSQTLTRRWLNEQGDKVKFWFDRDVHEDALNQCDPIYVSRDALLTSSTTSQSWAKKYPHTHTVVRRSWCECRLGRKLIVFFPCRWCQKASHTRLLAAGSSASHQLEAHSRSMTSIRTRTTLRIQSTRRSPGVQMTSSNFMTLPNTWALLWSATWSPTRSIACT